MTSTISWLRGADGTRGESWNPIRARDTRTKRLGHHCEHVHEGCRFCYAEDLNLNRRDLPYGGTRLPFKPAHLDAGDVEVFLDEERLLAPLSWKKPKRIFVESMSDPYGRWVDESWLHRIRAVQAATPQHTYIELTKRPSRMKAFNNLARTPASVLRAAAELGADGAFGSSTLAIINARLDRWPLSNVIGGASCSIQADLNVFGKTLLETSLAVRVISLEPMLAPVNILSLALSLDSGDVGLCRCGHRHGLKHDPDTGGVAWRCHARGCACEEFRRPPGVGLHGAIVGFESGADARSGNIAWIRAVIDQCRRAGVACFVKQLGRRPLGFVVDDQRRRGARRRPIEAKEVRLKLRDRKGEDWSEWPEDLRVREFPAIDIPVIAAPPMAQLDMFPAAGVAG
jgi:protein gp37